MAQEENYIGYLKYKEEAVKAGRMDIRKSAEALLGLDDILRYFLVKEDPSLKDLNFEIPVQIRKGSWEILIIETLVSVGWIYLAETAKKAA